MLRGALGWSLSVVAFATGCGDPPPPKTRIGTVQQRLVGANVEVSVAPGSANEQAQIDAMQNEQAIVRTMAIQPGQSDPVPALVAAYHDYTDLDTTAQGYTYMGWAISYDAGASWERQDPIPPPASLGEAAEEGQAWGARGDPWLAATPDSVGWPTTVWYVNIAVVNGSRQGLVLARSGDGGASWTDTRWVNPFEEESDKPSVAYGLSKVHIAYTTGSYIRVLTATSPGNIWSQTYPYSAREQPTIGEGWKSIDTNIQDNRNPIVRADPYYTDNVYVSFETLMADGTSKIWFAMSTDQGQSFDEPNPDPEAESHVVRDLFRIDPHSPSVANPGQDIVVRNPFHHSFVIDEGNGHCIIAYQHDGRVFFTGSADGVQWDSPEPTQVSDQPDELLFQPVLADSPPHHVAIAYYGQNPATLETHLYSLTSPSHGEQGTWIPLQITQSSPEGSVPWLPCSTDSGFFGDYIGLTDVDAEGEPGEFYALWTDSRRGCVAQGFQVAEYQKTMGTWFRPSISP